MSDEPRETRLRRLVMRANRRGIKEMDVILGRYAVARLDQMDDTALDLFDALLEEKDQDLYQWVTGQSAPPAQLAPLIEDVTKVAFGGE